MPEIAVNRVEYTVGDTGPTIHVMGRDAEGNAKHVEVTGMRPYFYTTNKSLRGTLPSTARIDRSTQFKSIIGEPCTRIYTTNPGEVRDLRERFDHLEADVVFTVRFQIDTGIKSGMSYPSEKCDVSEIVPVDLNYPSRVCMLDLECSDENGWPDARSDPITAITCHDSFTKQYVTFVLGDPSTPIPRKENCTTAIYWNEKDLLKAFIAYINDTDPDILTGWNVNDFDIPYIMGRFEANRLDKDSIARLPGMSLHDDTIRGRQVFDLLAGYKRMHLTKKESYRLDAIAEAEIGEHKVHFSGKICELPLETLVEYNRKDVELCVRIDAKDEIIDFHREIAKYVGCSLDRTLNSMPLIDVYILRKARAMKFILPSKGKMKDDGEQFEGATVFAPRKGLHKNCIVLDLTSLYPMVMMTGNMSPDTKDPAGEIMAPTGVRFRKSPDGMVRSIQAEFFASRKEMKRMRGTFDFGSRDYKLYDMKQNVVKVLMNSYYGVSGNSAFRLYDKEIGASVTSVGREILKHNKKLIEEEGLEVIMGDSVGKDSRIMLYDKHGNFISNDTIAKTFDAFAAGGVWSDEGKEYCIPRGVYTDTINSEGKAALKRVNYMMRHKCGKKMYRVNLTNYWSVDVTEDHSLIGIDPCKNHRKITERITEVKPEHIGINVKSLLIKKQSFNGNIASMGFPKEFYELMGYFIGCGSFESISRRCCLAGGEDCAEVIEKIFNPLDAKGWFSKWYIKSEKKGDISFYGKAGDFLQENCRGEGTQKIIPSIIYSETFENQCAFLRGLFSSDGSCMVRPSGPIVRYCSIDKYLCEEIQSVLHLVGIPSSIFRDNTPNSYNGVVSGTHSYLVYIRMLEPFAKQIGFIEDRKQSRISGYTTKMKKELLHVDFDVAKVAAVKEIEYDDYVYDIEVQDTHKFFANNILVHNTDSCVAPVDEALGREGTIALARMLEKKLNDSYPGFAKSCLNADVSYFSVKFEKLYERFFSGGRKKRYAGLLVWKEGKDVKEVDVVGYEMKRSDTPLVTKGVQKMLIEKVLNGDTYENIRKEVSLVLRVYRADGYTLDEIGIPGGIGKALDEYENPDAQVRGCIYANNHFGANFGRGSKPKRIYIKRVPPQYPRTDVICFEYGDQVPEGFVPDKELMIEKTIRGPLERIMEALDWDWIDFDPTTPTLAMWGI